MDISNQLRQLESLLCDLLPRDCPENVYILTPDEAGPRFCITLATAFTGCGCDLRLKPRLEQLGLWRGPGFAMVVNDIARFAWLPWYEQLGIALHEFGHFIWFQPVADELSADEVQQMAGKAYVDPAIIPDRLKTPDELALQHDGFPFAEHGSHFTRICLHLRHRAAVNFYDVSLDTLHIAGPRYAMSPASEYFTALGNEPQDRIGERIFDIVETDPPAAFSQLFYNDLLTYFRGKIRAQLLAEFENDPAALPRLAALIDPPSQQTSRNTP